MDQHRWGNYGSCCRLCLHDNIGSLTSIFEDVVRGQELVQQIQSYIGIEVKADDKLTTMICEQCLSKIHMWNTFKKSCFENQDKLVNWMNSWESSNVTPTEIQIKQETLDQSFESAAMEEDIYDEPPPLTPQLPENIFLNSTDENLLVENEINQNEKQNAILNGVVVSDANSTMCSFCDKNFSSHGNRRRHEKHIHKYVPSAAKKDPLATPSKSANNEVDIKKIQFAAGLQLKQRSAQSKNSKSEFTYIEIVYLEKYKNILTMADTLVCVCHNENFNNLQDLFLHLKHVRSWLTMYTCYNCLITYCDRGSYMRHYVSCPKESLCNLRRLSEFSKNSEIKIRIYQNFKCLKCEITYALYEDFCNHLDDKHLEIEQDLPPYTCLCSQSFDELDDLKQHINVSCFISYCCDVCFTCYVTKDEFKKHCEVEHDPMDANTVDSLDYSLKPKVTAVESASEVNNIKERRISTRRRTLNQVVTSQPEVKSPPVLESPEEKNTPKSRKVLNPHAFRHLKSSKPATCPECNKMYSSYHNMLRHYTVAHDENGLILICSHCPEKFRLMSELKEHEETVHESIASPDEKSTNGIPKFSCPDCKDMFNSSEEWKKHIETHPKQACEECGKQFNLQSDLQQHRSVHLNIKVYRDSKTQNYKSAMLNSMLSCSVCDVSFATKEEFLKHKLLHEKMPKLSAQDEELMDKKDDIKRFIKTQPDQEPVKEFPKQCPNCDKVILSRGAYGNHQKMHERLMGLASKSEEETPKPKVSKSSPDSESYHTCKRCFKVFSSKSSLKGHMKSHGTSSTNSNRSSSKTGKVLKTYWCDICHQACIGYAELQEHKQEHRQTKVKVAEIVSEPDLPQQNNPFIFVCDICSSSFSTNFALKRHIEKHDQDAEKQNSTASYCKYCKIPFASTEQLNEHMISEHDEPQAKQPKLVAKTYACKICKKVFDNGSALSSHQGWHKRGKASMKVLNVIKPIKSELPLQIPKIEVNAHQCTSCALQFVNETALQIHILETHRNITRVLQLHCSSCRTSFDSKAGFDTHMELHKVVERQQITLKRFACTYCSARFSRKDRLRGHMKLHHGDYQETVETFNCTQCNRSFDKENAFIIHLKVHERHRLAVAGNEVPKSAPKSAPSAKLYFCSVCRLSFALAKDLRTHVITAHPF